MIFLPIIHLSKDSVTQDQLIAKTKYLTFFSWRRTRRTGAGALASSLPDTYPRCHSRWRRWCHFWVQSSWQTNAQVQMVSIFRSGMWSKSVASSSSMVAFTFLACQVSGIKVKMMTILWKISGIIMKFLVSSNTFAAFFFLILPLCSIILFVELYFITEFVDFFFPPLLVLKSSRIFKEQVNSKIKLNSFRVSCCEIVSFCICIHMHIHA